MQPRRTPLTHLWQTLLLCMSALLVTACSMAPVPQQALEGVSARAFRKLRTEDLDPYVTRFNKPLMLVVGDAKLTSGAIERRAYITPADAEPIYLGTLQRPFSDAPLEALCFELAGDRFIAVWVDESISGTPSTVTLARPMQQAVDDSMNTLRVGAAANRVAILPIAAEEAALWQQISEIRIQTRAEGFVWHKQYEPPLSIESCFTPITLSGSEVVR